MEPTTRALKPRCNGQAREGRAPSREASLWLSVLIHATVATYLCGHRAYSLCPAQPCPGPATARPGSSAFGTGAGERRHAARIQAHSSSPPGALAGRPRPKLRAGKLSSLFSFPQSVLRTNKLSANPSPPEPNPSCSTPLGSGPQGQLRRRGCRVGPDASGPSLPLPRRQAGTHGSSAPGSAAGGRVPTRRTTRTWPWCLSGSERTEESEERARERSWSVPARWAGGLERSGRGGRPEPAGVWGLAGQ